MFDTNHKCLYIQLHELNLHFFNFFVMGSIVANLLVPEIIDNKFCLIKLSKIEKKIVIKKIFIDHDVILNHMVTKVCGNKL